jgi:hypothetical protein
MGLIIASAFVLVPGIIWFSGSLPVSAKNAFCSARIAVSTLTFALSFFVAETYPLFTGFWLIPATRAVVELRNSPAAEVGCFKLRRETCRIEVAVITDILVMAGKNLIRSEMAGEEAKIFCTPYAFDGSR